MHHLQAQLCQLRALVCDVDGVFTDGQIHLHADGESVKPFSTQDGVGIKRLQQAGFHVGIISGRQSAITQTRMHALGIEAIYQGNDDKIPALHDFAKRYDLSLNQIAYIGDDLPDLPVMQQVGLAFSVPNANLAVKQTADWITAQPGGMGAIREVCDLLCQHVA